MRKNDGTEGIGRRTLLLIGAAAPLAACGGLSNIIGPPPASQIYLLRPPAPAQLDGTKVSWALSVALPDAPGNLDTDRIAVERSTDTADYYANAVWPDDLTSIVQDCLVRAFEASGLIDSVVADTAGIRTDYALKTEITHFEARYATPDGPPTAVVAIAASVVAVGDRMLAAHHVARQESLATANTVEAAVQAFGRALGLVVNDIVRWTVASVPSSSPELEHTPEGSKTHRR